MGKRSFVNEQILTLIELNFESVLFKVHFIYVIFSKSFPQNFAK
jgi:hypothetical protein